MKKFLFFALAVCLSSHTLFAADIDKVGNSMKGSGTYGMAGCGLGSMLFQDDKQISQILAATTNGTSGNQTFGISTGTSNCTSNGLVKIDKETQAYVEVNYDVLQKDIARGEGETLAGFASLLGCNTQPLGQVLQKSYTQLSSATDSIGFLANVQQTIAENPTACETL
ncbi:MAG: DUF3015 family protein [Bdellovibrionota bacterium]|nr:DUF3015 family protein [Deltaproteobacteria bacterium]